MGISTQKAIYDESMDSVMMSYDKDENNWILISSYPTEFYSLQEMEGDEISVRGTNGILFEMEGLCKH